MDKKKSAAGRIGAHVQHSRHDPLRTTEKARRTFLDRFEYEVDPDGVLPEAANEALAVGGDVALGRDRHDRAREV